MKFKKYFVSNGKTKARVRYSLDNRIDGRKCVTIYAKDWDRALGDIFSEYVNHTDSQSDYFDQGKVCIFEDNVFYKEARDSVENFLI